MKKRVNATRRFSFRPKVIFTTKAKDKSITGTRRSAKTRLSDGPADDGEDTNSSSAETADGEENGEQEYGEAKSKGADSANGGKQHETVEQDPFKWVGETRADLDKEDRGELCELHSYDSRYNSKGEKVVLRTGSKYVFDEEEEKSPKAALVLIRHVSSQTVTYTSLQIKSPYIKKALKTVIGSYPGVNIDSERTITISGKPRCLFHYRHELRKYAETTDEESTKLHVLFCLRYMEKALSQEISTFKNMTEADTPRMDYENLWMIFKPSTLVYTRDKSSEFVYKFNNMFEDEDDDGREFWELECEQVQSDGTIFGLTEKIVKIPKYEGFKALTDLIIFPLEYHKDCANVRETLMSRGRKYASLLGIHYRKYDGVLHHLQSSGQTVKEAKHRIMVDAHEYYENYRLGKFQFAHDKIIETKSGETPHLSEENYLMCDDRIPGFSLTTKTWGFLMVDKIEEMKFNPTAFDKLALAEEKKTMIAALVRSGQGSAVRFDDMIKGKGKGIIFLLHGPPGVGKTFTAESIAESIRRPLYTIGSSDLSAVIPYVERKLSAALELATKWNAVVLIDEADVFMAERCLNDLTRNELVSVFLRVLEYFEGILFLTTNQVNIIDPAFKSRIHCTLEYPNLSVEARCDLWRTFIAQGLANEVPDWADKEFITRVAKHNMNGRQIKNATRVAFVLAHDKGRGLLPEDILLVLHSGTTFEVRRYVNE